MRNNWGFSNDIIDQGYKAFSRGVLFLGSVLIALAIAIFIFPALIGIIFAGFILFAGISVLTFAYRLWKMRSQQRPFEWEDYSPDDPVDVEVQSPNHVHKRVTFVFRQ